MLKIAGCVMILLASVSACSQTKTENTEAKPAGVWWTLYLSTAIHPPDVTIGHGNMGWGSGQTLLFPVKFGIPYTRVPLWLGLDFNHHYFGSVALLPYRVHYENWQLSMVARLTNATDTRVKPFIDFQLGGRYLVSFSTYDRTYSQIALYRSLDAVGAIFNIQVTNSDDYQIVREYGKVLLVGGFSPGVLIPFNQKRIDGIQLRGSILFGSQTRFADREQMHTPVDALNYPLKNGSRAMYTIQFGITF